MNLDMLTEQEYEEFVSNHEQSHFMKSYYFGEVMKHKNFNPHYVGFKKDGSLVATAMLLEKKIKKYSYFYCPRGFIIDYNDLELLREFTLALKKYAKKYNAIFIKVDPDIKRHNLDLDGNVDSSYNNYDIIDNLAKLGYKHRGFSTGFEDEQPRFTFSLNLDRPFDEVYLGMHHQTRSRINKDNPYGLELYIGDKTSISDVYKTMVDVEIRENVSFNSESYYENFYSILNEHNMSDVYLAKCNIDNLKNAFEKIIDEETKEINELKNNPNLSRKDRNKLSVLEDKLVRTKKGFEEVKTINENEVVLASSIITKYNGTVWTVHGGNSTLLRWLNANYWLQYNIIKDAHTNGYKEIDFFGTSGIANPDSSDPIYGIHSFKKRLGGEYIEYIGEFDLVCKPFLFWLYNIIIPIRRKMIKAKLRKESK